MDIWEGGFTRLDESLSNDHCLLWALLSAKAELKQDIYLTNCVQYVFCLDCFGTRNCRVTWTFMSWAGRPHTFGRGRGCLAVKRLKIGFRRATNGCHLSLIDMTFGAR